MRNYKEMAKAMREETLKYRNGVLEVSVELWEEIADALEEKPQGAAVLELLYEVITEHDVEIKMERDGAGGIATKVRKDGMQFAYQWEPEPLLTIGAEEDFFYRLRYTAMKLLGTLERKKAEEGTEYGQTIGVDAEA